MKKKFILLATTIIVSLSAYGSSYAAVDYSQWTYDELWDKMFDESLTFEEIQEVTGAVADRQKQMREEEERKQEEARLKRISENPYTINEKGRDSKSGLATYRDNKLELSGFVDRNNNIVIPAKWKSVSNFFAGYAMAMTDNSTVIINEQGEAISTVFNEPGFFTDGRFVENDRGLFGYYFYTYPCFRYTVVLLDGKTNTTEYPEFIHSSNRETNLTTIYDLGTFRDGSANIYRKTVPYIIETVGAVTTKVTVQAVGSITINGEFSTDINPKSTYIPNDDYTTKYGEKQFSENPVNTSGWKQDKNGWWYQNSDGTYPTNTWKEINGKQYYFGSDGYMLSNTITPDGYKVGADGAWIQ